MGGEVNQGIHDEGPENNQGIHDEGPMYTLTALLLTVGTCR